MFEVRCETLHITMKISGRAKNMNKKATSDIPAPLDCLVRIFYIFSAIIQGPNND